MPVCSECHEAVPFNMNRLPHHSYTGHEGEQRAKQEGGGTGTSEHTSEPMMSEREVEKITAAVLIAEQTRRKADSHAVRLGWFLDLETGEWGCVRLPF